ncbi:MAG: hypothetical protein LBE91_21545 [Tannerella sp.]|jgi:hypothetical protein|nr:hypothetical protein [Tannerella sp.]
MATITLQYNTQNPQALSLPSSIRKSGVFKVKDSMKKTSRKKIDLNPDKRTEDYTDEEMVVYNSMLGASKILASKDL